MEYEIDIPAEEEIKKLRVGDIVYITGIMVTARDEAHKKAIEMDERGEALPIDFSQVAIFHCGPIMKKNEEWKVVAAGPTTSSRMELFEDEFLKRFGTKIIVGKGGMGERTTKACKEYGAIYCAFTGGAAVLAAQAIKKVRDVFWLDELGMPECLWVFDVERFGPLTVTIDTHGNNLTEDVKKKAIALLKKENYK
ncbi:MAG: fumarate hydratase [Thermoplasmata archaeon]|nr:MAG: fumarate hydratase [Thermoplasmata archaeon]